MRRASYTIGYCTNVHAGASLEQSRANLERYALAVKRRVSPSEPMGVGLWLSAKAARELVASGRTGEFADWLASVGLMPFTFNGFPHGDFHQDVVKHRVYEPTWANAARLEYTQQLVDIQHALLPPGAEGSISTLPLQWGQPPASHDLLQQSAKNLRAVARHMAELEQRTGRLIHLAIEPEPGCELDHAADIVRFFQEHLFAGNDEPIVRRHIRVCHDVCHAAVMFEEQADVLAQYQRAGIEVGKVQVSSAVIARFDGRAQSERQATFEQLSQFNEPRYLHQTVVRRNGQETFHEDLPPALAAERNDLSGEWRTHFHVPIYLDRFGHLNASQTQIRDCLANLGRLSNCRHLEVETYAWSVLPNELQQPDLAAGIAAEMEWLDKELSRQGCTC